MPLALDSNPAEAMQPAAHFDGLLQQSRDLICESLDQAIASMLDKSKDALTTLINGTRNFEERRFYEEARAVAMAERDVMEQQFKASYLGEFRRRSDRHRRAGESSEDADDGLQLELVGEDDFEETLKFNNMAAKLRAYCVEELVALDQRVGVLLGDANLQANDNPFSPQVICDAYKHACRHVDANPNVRKVFLRLFDDHVLDDVRSMYKAVNGLLVQNAILPKIRYSVSRSEDRGAPGRSGAEGPGDPSASDITTGVAQDLFAILQNLAASNALALGQPGGGRGVPGRPGVPAAGLPAGFPVLGGVPGAAGAGAVQMGAGGAPAVLQGTELQSSLTRIQVGDLSGIAGGNLSPATGVTSTINVLHELKGTSVAAGMGSLDLMTLDIIAMLFDQLFDDPKTPNGVKGLIGRLQIPMLKVAIADKTFFSTKTHPARRLLDKLGEVALRLPPDFSPKHPLFTRLQTILEELVQGFKDSLEIFSTTREKVEALLDEEDQRLSEAAREAARVASKRMEEMENLAVAKHAAAVEVRDRVQKHKLPGPVREFLVQQWLKLLLLIHVKEGKASDSWKSAVETMDQLVWSIEPKNTREERGEVIAVIPGLIKKLAVGMKSAGIGEDVRARLFSHLIQYHKQVITAPGESPAEPAPAAGQQPANPPAEAKPADSDSLDFTAPVTIKNPFGEGDVKVDSLDLDFTAVRKGEGLVQRDGGAANPVADLTVGMWVGFRESADQPARRPGRLIFVTPRKTRYLFAFDLAGKDILPYSPGELARRFRTGDATVILEPRPESLFDRIMKGLVGKLRAPAAAR